MLVVNNGKSTVSSWGLVLKPGEQKKIYGLVSRKAIKCSSLSFYPDDADEVSMIKYNYPCRNIIMSNQYNLISKPVEKKSDPPKKEVIIKNDKSNTNSEIKVKELTLSELPEPKIEKEVNTPPPTPAPKRRRGRRPKVTQLITDSDLENARLEALKLDAKLEEEEKELQKSEN